MARKNILITGALGTAGSLLQRSLNDRYNLVLWDKRCHHEATNHVRVAVVDLTDFDAVTTALPPAIHTVVHLAASALVADPWEAVLPNNMVATYNLFENARVKGIRNIVFASTNHVTGLAENDGPIITPTSELRPDSLYACSKLFGEALARYYSDSFAMTVRCLRIGSLQPDNKVLTDERFQRTWLSYRDFTDLIVQCIEVDSPRFGIYYAVSDNEESIFDTSNLAHDLGFHARDDAAQVLRMAKSLDRK